MLRKIVAMILIACAGLMAGCAPKQEVQPDWKWTSTVKPTDPLPTECVATPKPPPKPARAAMTDKESLLFARRAYNQAWATRAAYKRCQRWAAGQR